MRCRIAFSFLLSIAPLFAVSQETVHMRVLINGSPVGENTYVKNADGSFTSKTILDLGSIKVSGDVSGHIKDGKLTDATASSKGPGGDSKIVYAKGRVDGTAQGKTNGGPWQDKTGALTANLHPQFSATTLLQAEKA
ncbi:MAG: hypothetical protein ACHQ50_17050, partial [Fimbriimonadales bacterium]